MRTPGFLGALRAWKAAQRKPGDPVDTVPGPCEHVRLREIVTAADQQALWDDADEWCREHVDHAAGHLWSRRIDPGPHHDERVPVFSFSDLATAMWFRMLF